MVDCGVMLFCFCWHSLQLTVFYYFSLPPFHSFWPFASSMDRAASVNLPFQKYVKKRLQHRAAHILWETKKEGAWGKVSWRMTDREAVRSSEMQILSLARHMHLLESMSKDCLVTSEYFAVSFKPILLHVTFAKNKVQMPFSACHRSFDQPT